MRLNRFGSLFIIIGVGAIFLFLVSDSTNMPDYRFLIGGITFLVLGSIIKWISPKAEKPASTRFRIFRKQDDDD
jgi:hypothetical protein